MATPLKFSIKMDRRDWIESMRRIGSTEIPQAVAYALDETAKFATIRFRDRILPDALNQNGFNAGGSRIPWKVTPRTRKAFQYQRNSLRYKEIKDPSQIKSSIFVQSQQGKVGADQSAYLKFQFGYEPNTRHPGDVGLTGDRILIPLAENLALTQKIAINPRGGEQPSGLLKTLDRRALLSVNHKTRSQVMKEIAAMGRAPRPDGPRRGPGHSVVAGDTKANTKTFRQIEIGKRSGDVKPGGETWPVFKKADPYSGLKTYYSRPYRDLAGGGGKHPVKFRDGHVGWFPDMVNVAPGYGKRGRTVGPYKLFAAVGSATYNPKLQKPWDDNAAAAQYYFEGMLDDELMLRLERMKQGRSY